MTNSTVKTTAKESTNNVNNNLKAGAKKKVSLKKPAIKAAAKKAPTNKAKKTSAKDAPKQRGFNEYGHMLNTQAAYIDKVVMRATKAKPLNLVKSVDTCNKLLAKNDLKPTNVSRLKSHINALQKDTKRKTATSPKFGVIKAGETLAKSTFFVSDMK